MGKTEKLLEKLENGTIKADELRTLLKRCGFELRNTSGSHEQWVNAEMGHPEGFFTLSAHGKDLLPYQIKEAKKRLIKKD